MTPLSPAALDLEAILRSSPASSENAGTIRALVGEVRRLRAEIDAMKRAALVDEMAARVDPESFLGPASDS